MRKPNVSVPSYRHHKPSGQAVVTLNAKDHYLGPWQSDSSRAEYKRLLAEWIAAGKTTTATAIESWAGITVAELLTAYLTEAETAYQKNGQPTSHLHNIKDGIIPLRELYAKEPVATFSPLKRKAVREMFVKRGLCRSTINKHIGTIKRIFKWGTENELVPATVFHALQAVSGLRRGRSAAKESVPVKPVPEAYVEAALAHVSLQVAAMVRLQQLTGMRPGEVTIMRGCDLDTSGRVWTGINTDLPGEVIGQVTENVFDSVTGHHLLIPQGSRLLGKYQSWVSNGQNRALVVWRRLMLPNGNSIVLDGMPGTDPQGYAGLEDQVDYHLDKLGTAVALTTGIAYAGNLARSPHGGNGQDVRDVVGDTVAQEGAKIGQRIVDRQLDVQPTITIRPGWPLRVLANKDILLSPYEP